MRIHYSAPGKVMVSGEWSILEMGTKAMVAAVNSRVHVHIEGLAGYDGISVSAEEFNVKDARAKYLNGKLLFMNLDDKAKDALKLLAEAVSTSIKFLENKGAKLVPFKITTSSKDLQIIMDGVPKKVGFGSSAAVVVTAVAAVLDFHGYKATKEEIYKLATIAHYYGQGKVGSAFDIAASSYGGLFVYSRFDPNWLTSRIDSGEPLDRIVQEKWPGFLVENLSISNDFHLLIGWTKQEASTSAMVKQMNEFKKSNAEKYNVLIENVASCAKSVIHSWKINDQKGFTDSVNKNKHALKDLGDTSGVNIDTPDLNKLHEIAAKHGAAGKLSGAGGGDCGIAICFDDETAKKITSEWKAAGIQPLETTIDTDGVRKER